MQELAFPVRAKVRALVSITARALLIAVVLGLSMPGRLGAVNVTVNVSSNLATLAPEAFGMHTSVYANQFANATLPGRFNESGVNTLRYSGGGYADVFHFSITRASWENGITGGGLSPWWGETNNFGYVASSADFGSFVKLLDNMGNGLAVITVNYGSALKFTNGQSHVPDYGGQPKEAAAWVAYANGDAGLFGTTNDITIGVDEQGNNWKTVGYWARLRASTSSQYQSWATAAGLYNSNNAFLAINRASPVGIKYWEIGNETFGTGYYDSGGGNGYSVDYHVPYDGTTRYGNADLSPAHYGQQVNLYAAAMKAVDPTIKIGAVLSTPPDDYSWDVYRGAHWNPEVLSQCASNIDFVIAHWYPWAGNNADGSNLLWYVRTKLPLMINGTTPGLDTGANAGLRDWINTYRPADGTNVEIFITEFGYMGSLSSSVLGPANAVFVADAYATWMDLGVANIDYLEMSKTPFVGDGGSLTRGSAFYAIKLVHFMQRPGDTTVSATSDQSKLRVHAAARQDGKLGVLLINTDRTNSYMVNVDVSGVALADSGTRCQFGTTNFPANDQIPSWPPSTNAVSGLGNQFSTTVPAYTMVALTIPTITNSVPVLPAQTNRTINELTTLVVTNTATDPDVPPDALVYALLNGPTNAVLNTNSGVITWTPTEAQGPGTNTFVTVVTDNGTPPLSATNQFTVHVNEVNATPTLAAIGDHVVNAGVTVLVTNSASDADLPAQTLTFSLLSAPTNATLVATNGQFSWRPLVTQADTTNLITVKVADNGTPSLSATQSFTVTVNPLGPVMIGSPVWSGGEFSLQVGGDVGPDYAVQVSTNLVQWETLFTTNSPLMPFQWTDPDAGVLPIRFYRIVVGPPLP